MTKAIEVPSTNPRYPHVVVPLAGQDGNAQSILGRTIRALRRAGVDRYEIATLLAEATSGDYNDLLAVVMRWVDCT